MVAGVEYAMGTTVKLIANRLGHNDVPIICTDSYYLHECLVKLGTTKEKRLMIDIMALRQSYERRELHEIRWIHGDDNTADGFTKASPNRKLEHFVENNKASIRVQGWSPAEWITTLLSDANQEKTKKKQKKKRK